MRYEIDFDKLAEQIKKKKARVVCLQLPDGLKPHALKILRALEKRCKGVQFWIWAGSNYGGCDWPWYLKDLGFDLIINFGHTKFK